MKRAHRYRLSSPPGHHKLRKKKSTHVRLPGVGQTCERAHREKSVEPNEGLTASGSQPTSKTEVSDPHQKAPNKGLSELNIVLKKSVYEKSKEHTCTYAEQGAVKPTPRYGKSSSQVRHPRADKRFSHTTFL